MKSAFAIGCWMPTWQYIQQTLGCIRSIRLSGNKQDIVVMTTDETLVSRIGERDWEVRYFPLLLHNGLPKHRHVVCDAQKLYFWKLQEYDRVLALDTDTLVSGDCKPVFEKRSPFTAIRGLHSPLHSGIMACRPDSEVFDYLFSMVKENRFDPVLGWENYGEFWWEEKKGWHDWNFFCAPASQGYLFYYFHLLKNQWNWNFGLRRIWHFCGKAKGGKRYRRELARMISWL